MSRSINVQTLEALKENVIRPFLALEVDWPNTDSNIPLRVWTGWGDIVFEGVSWAGLGHLLQINPIEENASLAVRGLRMKLDGLDSTILDFVIGTDFQGRDVQLYFGVMNEDATIIGQPISVFTGYLDAATISESSTGSLVEVTAENKILDFQRAGRHRYTVQDQVSRTGVQDKCFEFLPLMGTTSVAWGNHNSD